MFNRLKSRLLSLRRNIPRLLADAGCAREILWAQIFNNTISSSAWLKDASFSPGRAAVGYPFLYACYRILDGGGRW